MAENNEFGYCLVAGRTDIGCKRSANEDSMGQRDTINGRVVVVCDGMGGHVGGATASRIAVETILDYLDTHHFEDIREGMGMAIDEANHAILAHANEHPELTGMGSTCVLLVVRKGLVYIAHVGDSRIYLIRDRIITQLTKDHSFVQMLVDAGEITKEQAERHPRKNEITNALGIPQMTPATVKEDAIIPEAGDCFLLCSDGLSGPVDERTINKIVGDHSVRAQQRADKLIEKARENGGPDNITAQIVEFVMSPSDSSSQPSRKSLIVWCSLAGALLTVLVGVLLFLSLKKEPSTMAEGSNEEFVLHDDTSRPEDSTGIVTPPVVHMEELPSLEISDNRPQETISNKVIQRVDTIPLLANDSVVLKYNREGFYVQIGRHQFTEDRGWKMSKCTVPLEETHGIPLFGRTTKIWINDGEKSTMYYMEFSNDKYIEQYYIEVQATIEQTTGTKVLPVEAPKSEDEIQKNTENSVEISSDSINKADVDTASVVTSPESGTASQE